MRILLRMMIRVLKLRRFLRRRGTVMSVAMIKLLLMAMMIRLRQLLAQRLVLSSLLQMALHRRPKLFPNAPRILHREEAGIESSDAVKVERGSGVIGVVVVVVVIGVAQVCLVFPSIVSNVRVEESSGVEMEGDFGRRFLGRRVDVEVGLVSVRICVISEVVEQLLLLRLVEKVGESAR